MAPCIFQPLKERIANASIIPSNICFMDLKQLDKFIKRVNQIRGCATPGCKGALCPIHVKSLGLGGALSITYACNGCANQWALFETSSKYELDCATEISVAAQVAFIIAGCTHMTYYKVLKHALGIEAAGTAEAFFRWSGQDNGAQSAPRNFYHFNYIHDHDVINIVPLWCACACIRQCTAPARAKSSNVATPLIFNCGLDL